MKDNKYARTSRKRKLKGGFYGQEGIYIILTLLKQDKYPFVSTPLTKIPLQELQERFMHHPESLLFIVAKSQ